MSKSSAGKNFMISILLFVFLAIVMGVVPPTGTASLKVSPQIGNKAPDFTLNSLASKNVRLYKVISENKVTLINFWGIWCPYCVAEIPELVEFYSRYHGRRVEILAVDAGDNPGIVPAFAEKKRMAFPILFDKNNTVSNLYQIAGFPSTFIIDRQGMIKDIIVGATNQTTLAAKVETILKEK